jgi:hypothetical protein
MFPEFGLLSYVFRGVVIAALFCGWTGEPDQRLDYVWTDAPKSAVLAYERRFDKAPFLVSDHYAVFAAINIAR